MPKSDPIKKSYERSFTGCNRTSLSWAAYQAGWNAAKNSDQAIYDSIAAGYFRDSTQPAPRVGGCLMCGHCAATGEPLANPMANQAETSGSPAEQLREATRQHGHCPECHALHPQHHANCPVCEAKPGQEHAPACPRHPSDPMGVRRGRNG
jgi:hypothetical protein